MNKHTLKYIPLVAVPLVLCFVASGTNGGLSVLSLPFTMIGNGLRQLSLSGTGGNITLTGSGAELASSDAVKKAYLGG